MIIMRSKRTVLSVKGDGDDDDDVTGGQESLLESRDAISEQAAAELAATSICIPWAFDQTPPPVLLVC